MPLGGGEAGERAARPFDCSGALSKAGETIPDFGVTEDGLTGVVLGAASRGVAGAGAVARSAFEADDVVGAGGVDLDVTWLEGTSGTSSVPAARGASASDSVDAVAGANVERLEVAFGGAVSGVASEVSVSDEVAEPSSRRRSSLRCSSFQLSHHHNAPPKTATVASAAPTKMDLLLRTSRCVGAAPFSSSSTDGTVRRVGGTVTSPCSIARLTR